MNHSIAPKYARALIKIALQSDLVAEWGKELSTFRYVLENEALVKNVVSSPMFDLNQRESVLRSLIEKISLSKPIQEFLLLLLRKKHLGDLPQIHEAYQIVAEEITNKKRGVVTSALPLSAEKQESIRAHLQKLFSEELILDFQEDPSVLGGLRIQVGSLRFDDTLERKLETIESQFLKQLSTNLNNIQSVI